MTTVHNLGVKICRSEGFEQFEEFGLRLLLQHLLVHHYFSIPADAKEVCKITIEDMITHLSVLLYRAKNQEITIDEFRDFLVKKYEVEKEWISAFDAELGISGVPLRCIAALRIKIIGL